MSAFEYAGYDSSGRRCRGLTEARDAKEARERLSVQGILADRVRDIGAERSASSHATRRCGGVTERIRFYEELASLLGAGIPMVEALGILLDTPGGGVAPRVVARIRDAVRDGQPLAQTLATVFERLEPFEPAVVDAGQRAGAMAVMLERLAGFLETQRALAEKVRSALIYPAFVIGFAVIMVMGIVGFGLPAIGRLLTEAGAPLPAMIRWAMRWGRGAVVLGAVGILVAAAAVRMAAARAVRSRIWRRRLERFVFRLPLLGGGYTILVSLRFVRTLEMLVAGGHPLVESLDLSGIASGSAWVADALKDASNRLRHGGCTPSEAVASSPLLAAVALPAWMRSGEASGAMHTMLGRLADRLDQRWERFTVRALNLLLPVVILVVGVMVLAATLSILLPILNLNRMLLG